MALMHQLFKLLQRNPGLINLDDKDKVPNPASIKDYKKRYNVS